MRLEASTEHDLVAQSDIKKWWKIGSEKDAEKYSVRSRVVVCKRLWLRTLLFRFDVK